MKKKYILVIILGLMVALFSFYLGQKYYAARHDFLAQELNLDARQQQKYSVLTENLKKRHQQICNKLCAERGELGRIIMLQPLPKEKINLKLELVNKYQGEIEKETIDYICALQEILTPEQRKKYLESIRAKLNQYNMESIGDQYSANCTDQGDQKCMQN